MASIPSIDNIFGLLSQFTAGAVSAGHYSFFFSSYIRLNHLVVSSSYGLHPFTFCILGVLSLGTLTGLPALPVDVIKRIYFMYLDEERALFNLYQFSYLVDCLYSQGSVQADDVIWGAHDMARRHEIWKVLCDNQHFLVSGHFQNIFAFYQQNCAAYTQNMVIKSLILQITLFGQEMFEHDLDQDNVGNNDYVALINGFRFFLEAPFNLKFDHMRRLAELFLSYGESFVRDPNWTDLIGDPMRDEL